MAKRYGRNQKRRAREHAAQLEARIHVLDTAVSISDGAARQFAARYEELSQQVKAWDQDVRSLLGEYTAFAIKTGRHASQYPPFRIHIPSDLSPRPYSGKSISAQMVVANTAETIRQILEVEPVRMDLKYIVRLVHVDAYEREYLHINYAIDRFRLLLLSERDRAFLASDIATSFTETANRERNGQRRY
jgi:archaeosine-15-forming tRNA-guanine transglycosylase